MFHIYFDVMKYFYVHLLDLSACSIVGILWNFYLANKIFLFWKLLTAVCYFCSGCVGLFFPCFLFGKNAEYLGSGTLMGSCMTHFLLCALLNTVCCLLTDGVLLGLPGCFVASYACGYRRALRSKYNLPVRHGSL